MRARGLAGAALPAVAAVMCAALAVSACTSAEPRRSRDPLSAAIAAQLDSYTVDKQIRAIIVRVDGHRRFEHYYASSAHDSRSIFSVTKSVMSTLVGVAVSEGRLSLDERLSQMLPRYRAAMKPSVARVTLRELLTMTAGFQDTWTRDAEFEGAPDWIRLCLKRQDGPPGAQFQYSDYGAHLLSPILVQATGRTVLAYARAELFDPLAIPTRPGLEPRLDPAHLSEYQRARFAWPVDPQGYNTGAAWIKLRPRDMAALGQLYLQHGRWNGRQLVPANWVRQATSAQAGAAFPKILNTGAFDPGNYGYFWWVERAARIAAFYAWGYGGQLIEVVPQRQRVVGVALGKRGPWPDCRRIRLVLACTSLTRTRASPR